MEPQCMRYQYKSTVWTADASPFTGAGDGQWLSHIDTVHLSSMEICEASMAGIGCPRSLRYVTTCSVPAHALRPAGTCACKPGSHQSWQTLAVPTWAPAVSILCGTVGHTPLFGLPQQRATNRPAMVRHAGHLLGCQSRRIVLPKQDSCWAQLEPECQSILRCPIDAR